MNAELIFLIGLNVVSWWHTNSVPNKRCVKLFFFNITQEEHWYKLKCNSKILGLMSGSHKKGTVFDLTRHGCIESLDGRAVRLDDICQFGSLNLVKRVIFNDDPDWNTALRGACLGGHIDIVKFALDKGADYLDLELCRSITSIS